MSATADTTIILRDTVHNITVDEFESVALAMHFAFDLHHGLLGIEEDEALVEAENRLFLLDLERDLMNMTVTEALGCELKLIKDIATDGINKQERKHGINFRNR
jgi:hypothetical protein